MHIHRVRLCRFLDRMENLPPWQDFLEGRKSDMLRMRKRFAEWLEELHAETFVRHSSLKTRTRLTRNGVAPRNPMLSNRRRQVL